MALNAGNSDEVTCILQEENSWNGWKVNGWGGGDGIVQKFPTYIVYVF
jgi:hypothetical protein